MIIRDAHMDDALFLFRLRNDTDTIANSHYARPVKWDDHLKWLNWNLKDQFVQIHIGAIEEVSIGVVRVSEENTGKLFSWTIAPEFRGKGYGKVLVKAIVDATGGRLKAEIKALNKPSRKIAEYAGFELAYEKNDVFYYFIDDGSGYDHLAVLRHL